MHRWTAAPVSLGALALALLPSGALAADLVPVPSTVDGPLQVLERAVAQVAPSPSPTATPQPLPVPLPVPLPSSPVPLPVPLPGSTTAPLPPAPAPVPAPQPVQQPAPKPAPATRGQAAAPPAVVTPPQSGAAASELPSLGSASLQAGGLPAGGTGRALAPMLASGLLRGADPQAAPAPATAAPGREERPAVPAGLPLLVVVVAAVAVGGAASAHVARAVAVRR